MTGYLAFWVAIAFVVLATTMTKAQHSQRIFQAKLEMLRKLLESGQIVDPELVKELLKPEQKQAMPQPAPGEAYKAMRIGGTMALFLAAALFMSVAFVAMTTAPDAENQAAPMLTTPSGLQVPALVQVFPASRPKPSGMQFMAGLGFMLLMAGAGLHFCTRFVTPPPTKQNSDKE